MCCSLVRLDLDPISWLSNSKACKELNTEKNGGKIRCYESYSWTNYERKSTAGCWLPSKIAFARSLIDECIMWCASQESRETRRWPWRRSPAGTSIPIEHHMPVMQRRQEWRSHAKRPSLINVSLACTYPAMQRRLQWSCRTFQWKITKTKSK